ncbi:MAG: chromate transporter, partial [Dokdonella sp.]
LPGPEAHQLAIYIGWLLHRTRGGIAAGVLFAMPGILVLGVLAWLYVYFGTSPIVAAIFFGLKAAVLALVVDAVLRMGRRALKTRFLIGLAVASFVAIFALRIPFPWIVLGAGLIGIAVARLAPDWLPSRQTSLASSDEQYVIDHMLVAGEATHTTASTRRTITMTLASLALWFTPVMLATAWLGGDHVIAREGRFFSQAAVVTFGGAYAVLAYVAQRAVEDFGWIRRGEMIDGLALAETTPGPLIMVLQFVGFVAAHRFPGGLDPLVAGVLGAAITTWVTLVPSFLFIFVGAPYVEALRQNERLHSALSAITAAVVGVILNLSVWFALHTVFGQTRIAQIGPFRPEIPVWSSVEPGAMLLTVAALIAILRFKPGLGLTLIASALVGGIYWWIRYGV